VTVAATYRLGLPGPLIGTFVALLLAPCWGLPRVLGEVFHPSLRSVWKAAATQLYWGAPYAVVLWLAAHRQKSWDWLTLATEAALSVCVGLCLWWLSLGASVRKELRQRVYSIMGRKVPADLLL
jgi:hypothetical protein